MLNSFKWKLLTSIMLWLFCIVELHGQDQAPNRPTWVSNLRPPVSFGNACYIGSVSSSASRERALDEAYKGALIEVVRKEFPELIKITEKSSESLVGSSYVRDTVFQSDLVQFLGLFESKDSPFIEDARGGGFNAFRMLCWTKESLDSERKRQIEAARDQNSKPSNRFEGTLPLGSTGKLLGKLEVVTIPAGATILLEASPIGFSNAIFENVVVGSYELILQKDGYSIKREPVTISTGKVTKLKAELSKIKSTLSIKSVPDGARVYINNKPLENKTPVDVTDDVGKKIDIRLELDDYKTEQRNIEFTDRSSTEIITMMRLDGRISILSTPSRASVTIDFENKGTTPKYNLRLSGGKHSLQVRLDGYKDYSENIDVKASKPITIIAQLERGEDIKPKNSASEQSNPQTYSRSNIVSNPRKTQITKTVIGLVTIGLGGLGLYIGKMYDDKASESYENYRKTTDSDTAVSARKKTKDYDEKRNSARLTGGALILSGIIILSVDI